jgi:tRNA (guanine37-N1)-methyltransferase
MMKRAQEKGLFRYYIHNLTDWTVRNTRRVDDRPYGGGAGTILTIGPLVHALENLEKTYGSMQYIFPSPRGKVITQEYLETVEKGKEAQYCIICGHYEGVDERLFELFDVTEVSLGEYVLSSGEL